MKSPTVPSTYEGIRQDIKDALKQSDMIIFKLPDSPDTEMLKTAARSKLKGERRLKMVVFEKSNGELLVYKKSKRS